MGTTNHDNMPASQGRLGVGALLSLRELVHCREKLHTNSTHFCRGSRSTTSCRCCTRRGEGAPSNTRGTGARRPTTRRGGVACFLSFGVRARVDRAPRRCSTASRLRPPSAVRAPAAVPWQASRAWKRPARWLGQRIRARGGHGGRRRSRLLTRRRERRWRRVGRHAGRRGY